MKLKKEFKCLTKKQVENYGLVHQLSSCVVEKFSGLENFTVEKICDNRIKNNYVLIDVVYFPVKKYYEIIYQTVISHIQFISLFGQL